MENHNDLIIASSYHERAKQIKWISDFAIPFKSILDTIIDKVTKVPMVIITDQCKIIFSNKAANIYFDLPTCSDGKLLFVDIRDYLDLPSDNFEYLVCPSNSQNVAHISLVRKVFGLEIACKFTSFAVRDKANDTQLYVLSGDKNIPTSLPQKQAVNECQKSSDEISIPEIITRDHKMLRICELIRGISDSNANVLLTGESGTGKEVVARAIHDYSSRSHKSYLAINCAALPDNLLETELFGYVKGAFTGADEDKIGLFKQCDGGTLLLDEIGDASVSLQAKLLRVLQDGTFNPVGASKALKVDVRIISATNKSIKKAIKNKRFREDLFYRLCVIPISIPPVSRRMVDVPLLLEFFAGRYNIESLIFDEDCHRLLCGYNWPGNVREIKNTIQYIAALCREDVIQLKHLPDTLLGRLMHSKLTLSNFSSTTSKSVHLEHDERKKIVNALVSAKGQKTKAAKTLNINRATLYRRIKKYNINTENMIAAL